MSVLSVTALLLGGALLTEATGYCWHRWACHAGILRRVLRDLLRRRHFDHHMNKYGAPGVRHDAYSQSCDIAFRVLGLILLILTITSTVLGWIHLAAAAVLVCGIVSYSFLGARLHALYHLSDRSARLLRILQGRTTWMLFSWLRDFHDVHHLVNANYSLALPVFDLLGGTFVSPKRLPQLRSENLFPRFDVALSSSCDDPLF